MGTRFNLLLPGIDPIKGDKLFLYCKTEIDKIEKMLSIFHEDSDVSFINNNAFHVCTKPKEDLFNILEDCIEYKRLTLDTFNICAGKKTGSEEPVTKEKQSQDSDNTINELILDKHAKTVRLSSPQTKIDLGAYGKGYALEKINKGLVDFGVKSAFISFGESSINCIGKHPYGDFWPVGIQDAYNNEKNIATLRLNNQSVATSGNIINPDHIIDPAKGKPVKEKKMVTVKSANAITSEVLSTALMVADDKLTKDILKNFPGLEVLLIKYQNKEAEILKYTT